MTGEEVKQNVLAITDSILFSGDNLRKYLVAKYRIDETRETSHYDAIEVVDRLYILRQTLEEYILMHPVVLVKKDQYALLQIASSLLGSVREGLLQEHGLSDPV